MYAHDVSVFTNSHFRDDNGIIKKKNGTLKPVFKSICFSPQTLLLHKLTAKTHNIFYVLVRFRLQPARTT